MTVQIPSSLSLSRATVAVSALAALTLTACASDENAAEFADAAEGVEGGTDTSPESDVAEAESGLVVEDFGREASVVDTIAPKDGEVISPAGTLTIESVEVVDAVPATAVGSEEAEELHPAEGEVFRVVDISFISGQESQGFSGDATNASADLALNVGGVQDHLHALDESQDHRVLVSVPEDGSSQLVVSSEGHNQTVDVLTGERQIEDDDAAAAYYRATTDQDLNHTFPTDSVMLGWETESGHHYSGELEVEFDSRVNSASLTAWTPEGGWATPGEAWLVVDWSYEFPMENHGNNAIMETATDQVVTLTAKVEGETMENEHLDREGNSEDQAAHFSVPINSANVSFSFDADTTVEIRDGWHLTDGATVEFTTDELEVTFPDDDSNEADDESIEDDAAEEDGQVVEGD